jgi:hypothetical protein
VECLSQTATADEASPFCHGVPWMEPAVRPAAVTPLLPQPRDPEQVFNPQKRPTLRPLFLHEDARPKQWPALTRDTVGTEADTAFSTPCTLVRRLTHPLPYDLMCP